MDGLRSREEGSKRERYAGYSAPTGRAEGEPKDTEEVEEEEEEEEEEDEEREDPLCSSHRGMG